MHQIRILICVLILSFNLAKSTELLKYLNEPEYDGLSRAKVVVSDDNNATLAFDGLVKESETTGGLLVLFEVEGGNPRRSDLIFVEHAAQLLESKNITVYRVIVPKTLPAFPLVSSYKDGDVVFIHQGVGYSYYGRRSPLSVLTFILKRIKSGQVRTISGKLDKIAFDSLHGTKLVGFFISGSPEFREFDIAARKCGPAIPFFAVTDRNVAKHLKLQTVGEVHLFRPFEKTPYVCPTNPSSAAEIEAFVNQHRGSMLTHLNEHNLLDSSILNPNNSLFLAIGEKRSTLGGYFHRLVLKYIKNATYLESESGITAEEAEAGKELAHNVSIVWIDPEIFPGASLMTDDVQRELKLPAGLPFYFGSVNLTNNESVWFNTSQLNTTGDKLADQQNIELLKFWIRGVLNKTFETQRFGLQSFDVEPSDVQSTVNGDIVLECVVNNQVGECLWLKDGKNIGFNLDRYAPHYSWRSPGVRGDCSLAIKGAQVEQDAGNWVCEVSGDKTNPTITSRTAVVTIESSPPKAEL